MLAAAYRTVSITAAAIHQLTWARITSSDALMRRYGLLNGAKIRRAKMRLLLPGVRS